jgi:hypothetical protein
MADKEKKADMELCTLNICRAENGYKVCASYEAKEKSLAQRAGWVPCGPCEYKDYVEKTKAAVVSRVKELLG